MSTKKYALELLENKRGHGDITVPIENWLRASPEIALKPAIPTRSQSFSKRNCYNDILSVQGMLPFLAEKEVSAKINIHASLESTNKTAKELAVSGTEYDGTIIISDNQTAGRGRYGRKFFSLPGHGIYMSFIIRPTQPDWINVPTLVTSYAAVSVCKAIETTTGKMPQIKWVNDIFLDGKKICGILTEAVTDFESGNMQWIVLGIGINFITPAAGFPEEIRHIAGSVFSESKPTITRNQLVAEIVNRVLNFNHKCDNKTMLAEYKKRLMMIGKKIVIAGMNEPFEATAIDIDDIGLLIVRKDNGEVLSLSAGEVRLDLSCR